MLILTRKIGESIVIGDDIVITILGVKGSYVRVGIVAPKDVTVHREEVYDKIKEAVGLDVVIEGSQAEEQK